MNIAYCLECTEQLEEDGFKHCPNPECSRFGLVTALFCSRKFTKEEMAVWRNGLANERLARLQTTNKQEDKS